MTEILTMASVVVRMMILITLAPIAWLAFSEGRRGMGMVSIGFFFEMWRLFFLQILKLHTFHTADDVRSLGLFLQSPKVSLIPEIAVLIGVFIIARSFHKLRSK